MEHTKADVRQVSGYGASRDDTARFLRELRKLRDGAGLGQAELAARAHFPYDSIRAAEVGPALPDLPVLSAYVRGCGGTTEEWEERWRSLTRSPSLPVPASRNAGRSDAATAGARIGSVSQVGESPDPSIIIAALSRVAEEMASPVPSPVPVSPSPDVPLADDDLTLAGHLTLADDLTLAEDSFPSPAETLTSVADPTGDKPAGWDPIRVSTAWPVIRDTLTAADEPARDTGSSGGTGTAAPWGAAPWATPAAKPASPSGAASDAVRTRAASAPAGSVTGGRHVSSTTRVVVLAAVLLCVLAVLLAVFA
ncbi:MAG TPA: helix-turn-helix transcriptional regulator [Trebonia sp.]|nr:helix-turn-helix transcriptional regulator [Trebonia sp.]